MICTSQCGFSGGQALRVTLSLNPWMKSSYFGSTAREMSVPDIAQADGTIREVSTGHRQARTGGCAIRDVSTGKSGARAG
eukprot:2047605-Rhodomonas_salina.3